MKIIFWRGTKCLGLAQNVYKFYDRLKKFGPAQNVMGPVEGRGITLQSEYRASKRYSTHGRSRFYRVLLLLLVWP
jgi:hypothetical protein